jgi:hypothetical protein
MRNPWFLRLATLNSAFHFRSWRRSSAQISSRSSHSHMPKGGRLLSMIWQSFKLVAFLVMKLMFFILAFYFLESSNISDSTTEIRRFSLASPYFTSLARDYLLLEDCCYILKWCSSYFNAPSSPSALLFPESIANSWILGLCTDELMSIIVLKKVMDAYGTKQKS